MALIWGLKGLRQRGANGCIESFHSVLRKNGFFMRSMAQKLRLGQVS
ncbi:MAG: hypothetical protein E7K67_13930 [Peptostreptococcaceae bacterium]|nr:hypothetical protein [Peptostreptococcaceae bacterium]